MSQDDIQKIKSRLGIEEVIGSYIELEKSGNNLKANCPFHNEKSPSFFVSPDRDSYYCFGCGEKGDIFNFVQKYEGVDFLGSLKILAERAGVELTYSSQKNHIDDKTILFQIMEDAAHFFFQNLAKNKDVINYLKERGLEKQTVIDWKIGYANHDWDNLLKYLESKKYKISDIEKVGLVKQTDTDKNKYYDKFRGRIMFPIFDSTGRVTAFTGRIFGQEDSKAPKYLNSPETVLFNKSKTLYAFNLAKEHIRKSDFAILVEGQTDVLMSYQAGYKNTVASSGTALTEDQLKMISRFSNNLVIAFDGDNAGINASKKAWQIALGLGMNVKIANLENLDPADMIKQDLSSWKHAIKNSKHIVESIAGYISEKESDKRKQGILVSQEIIPYLSQIKSEIDKSYYIDLVSSRFSISEKAIIKELDNYKNSNQISSHNTYKIETSDSNNNSVIDLAKINKELQDNSNSGYQIVGFYYWINSLKDSGIKDYFISEISKVYQKEDLDKLIDKYKESEIDLIFKHEELYKKLDKENIKSLIFELIKKHKLIKKNKVLDNLKKELKQAEKENLENVNDIWNQVHDLTKEINSIKSSKYIE